MIYIAAGALLAATVISIAALQAVTRLIRAHARERDLLINQIMHLTGRTWSPPPALTEPAGDFDDDVPDRFVMSPQQLPDHWGDDG